MTIIMMKSENAKFITRRLLGVLKEGVIKKIYITTPLPVHPKNPNTIITKPRILCHIGDRKIIRQIGL